MFNLWGKFIMLKNFTRHAAAFSTVIVTSADIAQVYRRIYYSGN
jgi:hypothetical protein